VKLAVLPENRPPQSASQRHASRAKGEWRSNSLHQSSSSSRGLYFMLSCLPGFLCAPRVDPRSSIFQHSFTLAISPMRSINHRSITELYQDPYPLFSMNSDFGSSDFNSHSLGPTFYSIFPFALSPFFKTYQPLPRGGTRRPLSRHKSHFVPVEVCDVLGGALCPLPNYNFTGRLGLKSGFRATQILPPTQRAPFSRCHRHSGSKSHQ
jgi:hypothetical protein